MRVTSSASSSVSCGKIEGRERASSVLPAPGGPSVTKQHFFGASGRSKGRCLSEGLHLDFNRCTIRAMSISDYSRMARELGRLGGLSTKKKLEKDPDYFRKLAKKRWMVRQRKGSSYAIKEPASEQGREMYRLYTQEKLSMVEIAKSMGVSRQRVHQVLTGYKSFSKSGLTFAKHPKLSTGRCEGCGGKATNVHHKDGNSRNNNESNLVPLCKKCHNTAHFGS